MATRQKLEVGREVNPMELLRKDKEKPRHAPTSRDGAKFPPLPPAFSVNETAKTFTMPVIKIARPSPQLVSIIISNSGLPTKSSCGLETASAVIDEYPSPKSAGNA